MPIDRAGLVIGGIRLAGGLLFLFVPTSANRLFNGPEQQEPGTRLLLRSMGYRDALIGGLLFMAAFDRRDTRRWFLASAGADAADLLGDLSVHHEFDRRQQIINVVATCTFLGAGIWGALRRPRSAA